MGSLSDYAELELLDHIFNAAYPTGSTVYLALCTADPTDAGTGATIAECADANSYARTAIGFGAASSRVSTQDGAVTFPQATGGGWGDVTHYAVLDGNTHGADNMLAHGAFNSTKTVNENNTPSVATTSINVTFAAGDISTYAADKLLDLMFNETAFSKPATYVAMCTVVVADGDGGGDITEPSDGAYARKQVNINGGSSPTWDLAAGTSPGLVDNTHAVALAAATASWGTIVSVAVCDAITAGNVLAYDNTMTDQAVGAADTASFPVGDLDITLD